MEFLDFLPLSRIERIGGKAQAKVQTSGCRRRDFVNGMAQV